MKYLIIFVFFGLVFDIGIETGNSIRKYEYIQTEYKRFEQTQKKFESDENDFNNAFANGDELNQYQSLMKEHEDLGAINEEEASLNDK